MLLGNSSAPRWWDNDPDSQSDYLNWVRSCGATATEIVLHHGPSDERTALVHVLQPDWDRVIWRFRDAGMAVAFHASLTPDFSLSRWDDDRHDLAARFEPFLALAGELATDQGSAVLVVHGSADPAANLAANYRRTVEALRHLADRLEARRAPVVIALELRAVKDARPSAAAVSRAGALSIVHDVGSDRVGICWDIAHDVENAMAEPAWSPVPHPDFLNKVVHVHAHDIGPDGESHYPLVFGKVRPELAASALGERGRDGLQMTLEVRWRYAAQLGRPWDLLRRSYERAWGALTENESGAVLHDVLSWHDGQDITR